jgi:hypothetical protein
MRLPTFSRRSVLALSVMTYEIARNAFSAVGCSMTRVFGSERISLVNGSTVIESR